MSKKHQVDLRLVDGGVHHWQYLFVHPPRVDEPEPLKCWKCGKRMLARCTDGVIGCFPRPERVAPEADPLAG